jgi:hypothetical protein
MIFGHCLPSPKRINRCFPARQSRQAFRACKKINVTVQLYVTKLQWLTAETQRAQREDNFSFAVERTAKKLLSSFAA